MHGQKNIKKIRSNVLHFVKLCKTLLT